MKPTDVWFDLCVGEIFTDDKDKRIFTIKAVETSQLSALDVSDPGKYREELHNLLDHAIDSLQVKMDNAKEAS